MQPNTHALVHWVHRANRTGSTEDGVCHCYAVYMHQRYNELQIAKLPTTNPIILQC